jgi:hypothetical protein
LVEAELWTSANGGWWIHDFLDYSQSRRKVADRKNARSRAGRVGNDARWNRGINRNQETTTTTGSQTDRKPIADTDTEEESFLPEKILRRDLELPLKIELSVPAGTETRSARKVRLAEQFVRLWNQHPPRRGRKANKGAAEKQWVRLGPDKELGEQIIARHGLEARCFEWSGPDGYPPDLFRWIRDGRWVDEVGLPSTPRSASTSQQDWIRSRREREEAKQT